jgi:hypothetical protein
MSNNGDTAAQIRAERHRLEKLTLQKEEIQLEKMNMQTQIVQAQKAQDSLFSRLSNAVKDDDEALLAAAKKARDREAVSAALNDLQALLDLAKRKFEQDKQAFVTLQHDLAQQHDSFAKNVEVLRKQRHEAKEQLRELSREWILLDADYRRIHTELGRALQERNDLLARQQTSSLKQARELFLAVA